LWLSSFSFVKKEGDSMWIILIKKLPTKPSPPKMSIFWSTPWPDDHYAKEQRELFEKSKERSPDYEYYIDAFGSTPETATFYSHFGKDPNWIGARKIHFAGSDIRVFPHEFTVLKPENMRFYVFGDHYSEASHEFVSEETATDQMVKGILEGDDRFVYDAALVDGCNPAQAMATAMGMDITIPDSEFAPLGWYRAKPEVLEIFCHPWEAIEDRDHAEEVKHDYKTKTVSSRRRSRRNKGLEFGLI
jgi:hypothetical protein